MEVLSRFKTAKQSKEILEKLGITSNTLKFHSRNIYRKLGVKSRQEAEKMAVKALYPNGSMADDSMGFSFKF